MRFPLITVIILNYNGISDTKKCLKSVLACGYPRLKIVVVDNGSVRDEAKMIREYAPHKKVSVIRFNKNFGFTEGNNKVLKIVKTEYVVLLNNDVIVTQQWLQPIITAMDRDKKIAVAQPKILWSRNKKYFDYAGACGGYIDTFGYPFTRGRIFNTIEKDQGQYDAVQDVFWASGAAMIVRTAVFEKIGYFDTRFFNYMEEIDLCFRINKAGYRIVCIPTTHVFHKGAATSSKNELQKRFWEHRNNLLMVTKNFSIRKLLFILPVRFVLEYVSIGYYLANKRFDYAAAVILSQLSYIHLAPQVLLDRIRYTQHKKTAKNAERYIFPKSIIFDYFFLRKRTYAKLFG